MVIQMKKTVFGLLPEIIKEPKDTKKSVKKISEELDWFFLERFGQGLKLAEIIQLWNDSHPNAPFIDE